ncbi:DUF6231 family protein [Guyparkeria sp. 1SP6A2]|nr:DUF6231 family protein [Guyparkeria sp. 1SP6A2]
MNSTKAPALRVIVVPAEVRAVASNSDKRLIACEKSQSGDRRVTVYVFDTEVGRGDENTALAAGGMEITEMTQVPERLGESEVADVVVKARQWAPAIGQLLASLRDRGNRPIAVHLEGIENATSRMIALGFRGTELPEPVFKYDILDYKHTPDWLNARNWANPELWGKYRW